jgi:hypothetical protein
MLGCRHTHAHLRRRDIRGVAGVYSVHMSYFTGARALQKKVLRQLCLPYRCVQGGGRERESGRAGSMRVCV